MNSIEQIAAAAAEREARIDSYPADPSTALDGIAGTRGGEATAEIGSRLHFVVDVLVTAIAALQWEHFDASEAKHLSSLLSMAETAARQQLDVDTEISERLCAARRLARK